MIAPECVLTRDEGDGEFESKKEGAMRTSRWLTVLFGAAIGLAIPAHAGTKYHASLVPTVAGTMPGFSARGSSIDINGHRLLKGKIKNVVDGTGARITTDPIDPLDNYSVEVDLSVPVTAASGTVTLSFDLTNGNGKFAQDITSDPVFSGAVPAVVGDGVAVTGVRVKDSGGTVIGVGGFAIE
jgi:hypothetical protein